MIWGAEWGKTTGDDASGKGGVQQPPSWYSVRQRDQVNMLASGILLYIGAGIHLFGDYRHRVEKRGEAGKKPLICISECRTRYLWRHVFEAKFMLMLRITLHPRSAAAVALSHSVARSDSLYDGRSRWQNT